MGACKLACRILSRDLQDKLSSSRLNIGCSLVLLDEGLRCGRGLRKLLECNVM